MLVAFGMLKSVKEHLAVTALLVISLAAPAAAHEGLHEQIRDVTKQIRLEPKNAALYLKRGELHRLHRDWTRALSDYRRAEQLDSHLDAVHFGRGRMYFEAGKPDRAKIWLDRFLAIHPRNIDALVTRARVFVKMGRTALAAQDYSRAISQVPKPKPEYYIERARALIDGGKAYGDEALKGIDEGMKALGPIVTLQLVAIDIELSVRRYDAALARLDTLALQSPRKEAWLARRGDILSQAGRAGEARAAFAAALEAIQSLPSHIRKTKATTELESRVRAALK
jgi:tetratricopeptide (TPR) repeat protein